MPRIVAAMASLGYVCTRYQVVKLWSMYSGDSCAGWLLLGDDDKYVVEVIGEMEWIYFRPK